MTGPFRRLTQLPDPHFYEEDPKAKLCLHCPLPRAHEVHSEAKVDAVSARNEGWIAQDLKRLGEKT